MFTTNIGAQDYSLQYALSTLDLYNKTIFISNGVEGEEKFNILLVPFTGTINLIHSIVMNFTSRIVKIGRTVKRSELRTYHDRYPLNCLKALNANYIDILDTEIAVPFGMQSSYLETSENIKHFFDYVSVGLLSSYKHNMDELYKYISTRNMTGSSSFAPEIYKKSMIDADRENLFIKHTSDFSAKVKESFVPFKSKFKNIEEFKATDKTLLSLNEILVTVGKVVGMVHDTVSVTDKVVYYIQNSDNYKEMITVDFIKNLTEYVRSMAEAYDMYASVMEAQVALEHNFCKVIDKIYAVA